MAFHNLSYLQPSNTTTKKKRWTPTIQDSKDSFLITTTRSELFSKELKKRKVVLELKGIPDHPIILESSTAKEYFVGVGDTIYKCDSVVDAVDVAFKFFVVFKIPFPPECEMVWLFLNQFFYKIELKQQPNTKLISMYNSYNV